MEARKNATKGWPKSRLMHFCEVLSDCSTEEHEESPAWSGKAESSASLERPLTMRACYPMSRIRCVVSSRFPAPQNAETVALDAL